MGHDLGMKSKVHPKYKTKYHVNNWAEYDQALVQRGDITLWISEDAIESWKPAPTGLRGAQRKFSDHAIETALTLRLIFRLPLRQAEGFLRSILSLMGVGLEAPDHTTLSRRSQNLNVDLHRVSANQPIHLIIDSTGLSIVGEGEWAAAKYGGRGRRSWKKLHLGVDRSGVIVAEVLTDGNVNDAKTALELLDKVEGDIECLTADTRSGLIGRSSPMTPSQSTIPARHEGSKSSFHLRGVRRGHLNQDLGHVLAIVRS
jgi:hypothetical protein